MAAIVAMLEVDAKREKECLGTLLFRLRSAQSLVRFHSKLLKPGAQKRKAVALSVALTRARSLSQEIKSLFSAMLDDRDIYSEFIDPSLAAIAPGIKQIRVVDNYAKYLLYLDHAIAVADELNTTIAIPSGRKSRDSNKWQAKAIAIDLVAEFSPRAGRRATPRGKPTTTTGGEPGARGERGTIDGIASLIFQIFTGRKGVELTEDLDAYRPPTLRTRLTVKK
jgi:hypothetical protein